ncbi:hypothetical protein ACQCVP_17295 [Rossellomorea vietnamensis]
MREPYNLYVAERPLPLLFHRPPRGVVRLERKSILFQQPLSLQEIPFNKKTGKRRLLLCLFVVE